MIVDRFGAPEIVNANHQRTKILKGAEGPQIDERQAYGHEGKEHQGDLEIGVRHHGVTVLFEVEPFGVLKAPFVVMTRAFRRCRG